MTLGRWQQVTKIQRCDDKCQETSLYIHYAGNLKFWKGYRLTAVFIPEGIQSNESHSGLDSLPNM